MNLDSGFQNSAAAIHIVKDIEKSITTIRRPVRLMEVCGTHTVALRRHGIHSLLPDSIRLISGPGCPVCVTPAGYIDNALALVEKHGCIVASFGDMVKVPGSDGRTLSSHLGSGRVRILYSPSELPELCKATEAPVVFLAIGFETTIPVVVAGLKKAIDEGRTNIFLYTAFKTVPPALQFLLSDSSHNLDGFILPGHVSIIIGETGYKFLADEIAGVITGFEPLDMLAGLRALLLQVEAGIRRIENEYPRAVRPDGNPRARDIIAEYLEPADAGWRAIGVIPSSGLSLKSEYGSYDAMK
ncbi:MAG: hydrogenase formation protein HypD, partial [Spirochaetales bacterium]|nr:hydrogenase formation protein HypD [Spirochaetales bacterium]